MVLLIEIATYTHSLVRAVYKRPIRCQLYPSCSTIAFLPQHLAPFPGDRAHIIIIIIDFSKAPLVSIDQGNYYR